jgi:hypothetical protein
MSVSFFLIVQPGSAHDVISLLQAGATGIIQEVLDLIYKATGIYFAAFGCYENSQGDTVLSRSGSTTNVGVCCSTLLTAAVHLGLAGFP